MSGNLFVLVKPENSAMPLSLHKFICTMFPQFFFKAIFMAFLLFSGLANAQDTYRYNVDLKKLTDDKLQVELLTPNVKGATAVFAFPKIIPGTYSISDYGKFISNVKAFDKAGKLLS